MGKHFLLLIVFAFLGLTAFGQGEATLPAPFDGAVSFSEQIQPILSSRCLECHGAQLKMGNYSMLSREALIAGGDEGAAVVVGDSANSRLIKLVAGLEPGLQMPMSGDPLSQEDIALLRAWIDQGAEWDESIVMGAEKKLGIEPRRPALATDADSLLKNPIDNLLAGYYQKNKVDYQTVVDDRRYIRRTYLDLIGVLPSGEAVEAFAADGSQDKRAKLVDEVLSNRSAYAQHWLTFWNDLLRNEYRGTGFIDGGREQITEWLLQSLEENKPYDQFVAELIDPVTGSRGFLKGIVWRGVVNASQTPEMQAAQNVAQVFMGTNLKCASCHDSFINQWKLADSYGLAAVFTEKPLELVRCDSPTGKFAEVHFLYPELGAIDAGAPVDQRRAQLAKIMTNDDNGRLTRTIVNRIWARFMGRGIIEPVDDMEAAPWSQEVLDWLAADLSDNGYDLHRTMKTILTSRAYQLPAVDYDANDPNYVFQGPLVRRMSAEQFVDALSVLTGYDLLPPDNFFRSDGRGQGGQAPDEDVHRMLRFSSPRIESGSVEIDVDISGASMVQLVSVDNHEGGLPVQVDWIDARLIGPEGELPLSELQWSKAVAADAKPPVVGQNPSTSKTHLRTHSHSTIAYAVPPGYFRLKARVEVVEWPVVDEFMRFQTQFFVLGDSKPLRSSLVVAGPLQKALGRPNREQVTTQRNSLTTTLQALEISNGETLAKMLQHGARQWNQGSEAEIINGVFAHALGRKPTQQELSLASTIFDQDDREQSLQDLLWIVAMLPEFQLIY
ncbi:MAG: DUF1549 domain-containing protein [Candidatus Hinthialibacter antarcticus]|nr:DUF1549 domain-containing protein [Candidatus Hinthialibacter antarcticus]